MRRHNQELGRNLAGCIDSQPREQLPLALPCRVTRKDSDPACSGVTLLIRFPSESKNCNSFSSENLLTSSATPSGPLGRREVSSTGGVGPNDFKISIVFTGFLHPVLIALRKVYAWDGLSGAIWSVWICCGLWRSGLRGPLRGCVRWRVCPSPVCLWLRPVRI